MEYSFQWIVGKYTSILIPQFINVRVDVCARARAHTQTSILTSYATLFTNRSPVSGTDYWQICQQKLHGFHLGMWTRPWRTSYYVNRCGIFPDGSVLFNFNKFYIYNGISHIQLYIYIYIYIYIYYCAYPFKYIPVYGFFKKCRVFGYISCFRSWWFCGLSRQTINTKVRHLLVDNDLIWK